MYNIRYQQARVNAEFIHQETTFSDIQIRIGVSSSVSVVIAIFPLASRTKSVLDPDYF